MTELLWGWFCTSSAPYYRQGSLKHLIPVPVPVLVHRSNIHRLAPLATFFLLGPGSCLACVYLSRSSLFYVALSSTLMRCAALHCTAPYYQVIPERSNSSFRYRPFFPSFFPSCFPLLLLQKGLTFPPRSFSFSYPTLVLLPHTSEPISTGVPSHYALLTTHCHRHCDQRSPTTTTTTKSDLFPYELVLISNQEITIA